MFEIIAFSFPFSSVSINVEEYIVITRLLQLQWSVVIMLSLELAPCCAIEAGFVHYLIWGSKV